MPESGVAWESLCHRLDGLSVAGPRARELLARVVDQDPSTEAFPFLSLRRMTVGAAPAIVGRLSFTGELGYEIYVEPQYLLHLYETLRRAGADLGLKLFGSRALASLRLEKSFGAWTKEFTPDWNAFEAGLGRFVHLGNDKGDFIGRAAATRQKAEAARRKLVTLTVETEDIDAIGDEPVWHSGEIVGVTSSGGYGHSVQRSIALAYVPTELAKDGERFEVVVLGEKYPAQLSTKALWDPSGGRMRV
jgi:dimethylglycine dehydrogenase